MDVLTKSALLKGDLDVLKSIPDRDSRGSDTVAELRDVARGGADISSAVDPSDPTPSAIAGTVPAATNDTAPPNPEETSGPRRRTARGASAPRVMGSSFDIIREFVRD